MFHKYLLPFLAAGALAFAVYYVSGAYHGPQQTPSTSEPQVTETVASAAIAGPGMVEPKSQAIAVGSPLAGVVIECVDPSMVNHRVTAGDQLFCLDDRQGRMELGVRKAVLKASEAQLAKVLAPPRKVDEATLDALIKQAEANVIATERTERAIWDLYRKGGASLHDWGTAKQQLEVSRAQKVKAEADLTLLRAGATDQDKEVARAAVAQAKAQVNQQEIELQRLKVRAPIDGVLLQINVRKGEYVGAQPGQNLILLGSLDDLHVRVDIDEYDIPRLRDDAPARGTLRGQPNHEYHLEFVRREKYVIPKKTLSGDNAERLDTRVMQVIYRVKDKPDEKYPLYVGQQLDVVIEPSQTSSGNQH
jgi:multidrug resistance efflux pump